VKTNKGVGTSIKTGMDTLFGKVKQTALTSVAKSPKFDAIADRNMIGSVTSYALYVSGEMVYTVAVKCTEFKEIDFTEGKNELVKALCGRLCATNAWRVRKPKQC
jgi:hypothetical protein